MQPQNTVLISGADQPLGLAGALAVAEVGCPVILWGAHAPALQTAARIIEESYQVCALAQAVDPCDATAVQQALAALPEGWEAPLGLLHAFGETLPDALPQALPIPLWQQLLPTLGAQGGAIVLLPPANDAAMPWLPLLRASVPDLARELASAGVRLNWVSARHIQLHGAAPLPGEPLPLGRGGAPEEVANVARFLLSHDASYLIGQELRVDGGAG